MLLLAAGLGRWPRWDLLEGQRPPELQSAIAAAGGQPMVVLGAESQAGDGTLVGLPAFDPLAAVEIENVHPSVAGAESRPCDTILSAARSSSSQGPGAPTRPSLSPSSRPARRAASHRAKSASNPYQGRISGGILAELS
jgi:hypothetical protein